MAYEQILSQYANINNVGTLWAQIVANFIHAAPAAKGDILFWNAASQGGAGNTPTQPSHLTIGSAGDFLSVNNGVPVWTAFGTPSLAFSDTTTDAPKLAITIQGKTSTAVALPVADATHSGILTTGAQTIAGAKTFKETVHSEKDVEADGGVSAYGIADLSMGGGGGTGTVIGITYGNVTLQTTYTPVDGIVTLPKSADNITWTSTNQSLTQTQKTNLLALYDRAPSALWNSGNEIADKSFVNSSIATATATFRGTVTATDDTDAAAATALATISTKDDNDYAFVKVENTPQTGVDKYKRYKYNGSAWVYEYTLNNSSFTSDQWNAINSGITTSLVTDIGTLKGYFTGGAANNALQLEGHSASYFATASALNNYLLLTGGTLDAKDVYPLYLDNTASGATDVGMKLKVGGTAKGALLYSSSSWGTALLNIAAGNYAIGVKDDGTPYFGTSSNKYKLWHENNDGSGSGLDADLLDGQHGSYYAVKADTEEAINVLASAIGGISSVAYDNKEKINSIDEDVIELYGYFDGSSALHSLSTNKLATARTIWGQSFDGTANVSGAMSDVTNIDSLIYISSSKVGIGVSSPTVKLDIAGGIKTTEDISGGQDIYAAGGMAAYGITDLAMGGGGGTGTVIAIKFEGGSTQYDPVDGIITLPAYPSLIGYATQNWVSSQITALNLGTASTHDHGDYVTAITWDSTNRKLKQTKGSNEATDIVQFGSVYSHNHSEYLTSLGVSGDTLTWSKGGVAQTALTVPYATLSTDTKTELLTGQEFIYRQTAGGALTYKPSAAVLKRILGRTVVWNQQLNESNLSSNVGQTYAGITLTYDEGKRRFHIQGTATAVYDRSVINSVKIVAGHKYLLYAPSFGAGDTAAIRSYLYVTGFVCYNRQIVTVGVSSNSVSWYAYIANGQTVNFDFYASFVDLTLLYGSSIDGMTDAQILAKFESEYPGYHSYNAGQLINNAAEGLETVGFNQWDEEWEVGSINYSIGIDESANDRFRTKFISVWGGEYYYLYCGSTNSAGIRFYDKNKNYIGFTAKNGVTTGANQIIQMPDNCGYFRFVIVENPYIGDVCFNLSDTAKNGTYEPYRKSTMQLGLDSIKVYSHNIWDEEWEAGSLNSNGQPTSGSCIRSKNYIPCRPNTDYYIAGSPVDYHFYDANYNHISIVGTQSATSPANAAYIKFRTSTNYGTTYNYDICLNVSSSFNGQYEPHGILTINGLKQAGSVRDEIVGGKYIRRVGEAVYKGTEQWGMSTYSSANCFIIEITKSPISTHNAISSKYQIVSSINNIADKQLYFGQYSADHSGIYLRDDTYSNVTDFKNALAQMYASGNPLVLYYELATPIEYEIIDDFPTSYPIDVLGTERIVSDELVAPFIADIQYGAEQRDTAWDIDHLASKVADMDISHYSSLSDSTKDAHVITIGGKKLYLKFRATQADTTTTPQTLPAFEIAVADNAEGNNEQVFSFGTITEDWITTNCVLPS